MFYDSSTRFMNILAVTRQSIQISFMNNIQNECELCAKEPIGWGLFTWIMPHSYVFRRVFFFFFTQRIFRGLSIGVEEIIL